MLMWSQQHEHVRQYCAGDATFHQEQDECHAKEQAQWSCRTMRPGTTLPHIGLDHVRAVHESLLTFGARVQDF